MRNDTLKSDLCLLHSMQSYTPADCVTVLKCGIVAWKHGIPYILQAVYSFVLSTTRFAIVGATGIVMIIKVNLGL